MPTTVGKVLPQGCSVWPAFWTVGPDWPNNGEIDIIEYVNKQTTVQSTLHTSNGCSMYNMNTSTLTGTFENLGCYANEPGQSSNAGCGIQGSALVGAPFNQQGGGVYVTEWVNDKYIRMFYFPRASVPQDIKNKKPDPSKWGLPYARFDIGSCGSSCPSSHFKNNKIIFDTTFCGEWAGAAFGSCSKTLSCKNFVYQNPAEFVEAYWLVNYVDIYDFETPTSVPVAKVVAHPLDPPAYSLSSTYDASNFFANFKFDTIADPNHGYVNYVNYSTAAKQKLAKYTKDNKVYLGVGMLRLFLY